MGLQYMSVTRRGDQRGPGVGNQQALRNLREARELRRMSVERDPAGMNFKRGERSWHNVDIMNKMATLEP
ncbi:MAG: hypothetical protein O3B95_08935 [Chloroflexi bacterium]|nr:hypothetical protein [Chloroflexota bacterium]